MNKSLGSYKTGGSVEMLSDIRETGNEYSENLSDKNIKLHMEKKGDIWNKMEEVSGV